jgi:hypothetical protein
MNYYHSIIKAHKKQKAAITSAASLRYQPTHNFELGAKCSKWWLAGKCKNISAYRYLRPWYLLLGDETWIATGLTYNTQAVEMELSSAVDAIGAQAPNLRISREAVGALPSTGAIRSG